MSSKSRSRDLCRTVYFPSGMLAEIEREAARLDQSVSWVIAEAWRRARANIMATPAHD